MHGTSAVSIILVTIYMLMLDAAANCNVLFGDSLPLTRARSIAVSTANSCVVGDLPKLTT